MVRNNNNRRQPRIRGAKPTRIATSNYAGTSRTFRGIGTSFLQIANAQQGGVEGYFTVTNPLSAYVGSDFVSNNFEQYRVRRVKVYAKPSIAALTTPTTTQSSILYQNSIYSICNQTECQSFIDYDTSVNPTYAEILARPNMRMKALAPNSWTMIADFAPKTLTNSSNSGTTPSNTFNSDMWISTNQMDASQYGLRGRFSNRSNVLDTQDNVASVDTLVSLLVEMRGPINNATTTGVTNLSINVPATK
jgi:hypothetical protein